MRKIVAIIPARGGSKGVPGKNIKNFCGKPLIAWSVEQALKSKYIHSVWVSSDSDEILAIAVKYGAKAIKRPLEISGDTASSESAWLHSIDFITKEVGEIDLVLGIQATSPIRESDDFDKAVELFDNGKYDSLFSSARLEDYFIWKRDEDDSCIGENHDYKNRRRRQLMDERFLENGSFYIFPPELMRSSNNRLGGKIGTFVMDDYKKFQIDTPEDFTLCSVIMKGYGLHE